MQHNAYNANCREAPSGANLVFHQKKYTWNGRTIMSPTSRTMKIGLSKKAL